MAKLLKRVGTWAIAYSKTKYSVLGPRFYEIAKVELRPPSPRELAKVPDCLKQIVNTGTSGKWKTLTTQEAFLNCLLVLEVYFLFFVGESIGRKGLIGYKVEGTVHYSWISYLIQ